MTPVRRAATFTSRSISRLDANVASSSTASGRTTRTEGTEVGAAGAAGLAGAGGSFVWAVSVEQATTPATTRNVARASDARARNGFIDVRTSPVRRHYSGRAIRSPA